MSIVLSDTLSTKSRTTTTNITSASIDVITDLGTGVLITVLVNGQEKYEHESPSDVTLDLSQAGDEVTVTIIVNVMWSLTISGEGYDVKIGNLTYDSDRSPDYVLTGDVLTVQSKSGNSLTGIQSYGLRSNGHDGDYVWTFTVNGTGNAGLSLPVFSVVLTVDLVFMCGTSEVTLRDGWHPDGTLTVISEDGTELRAGVPTVDNMGHLVYTLTVDSGTYIVSATFGGFVSNSETLLVGSDSVDHSIILNAVEYGEKQRFAFAARRFERLLEVVIFVFRHNRDYALVTVRFAQLVEIFLLDENHLYSRRARFGEYRPRASAGRAFKHTYLLYRDTAFKRFRHCVYSFGKHFLRSSLYVRFIVYG